MIDGLSFDIPTEAVIDSDILEFKRYGNGERANYQGFIITKDSLSCSVRGSIHKYFNGGKHNYNDFTLSDFKHTIKDLEKTLNISAYTTKIGRVEVGVNLDLDMDVDEFISSVILFSNMHPTMCDNGIIFKLNDYDLKLYRKELRGYRNRLRIELVIKKKRKRDAIIKEYTTYCNTLSDLENVNIWRAFGHELESICSNLVLIDREGIDYTQLKPKDAELLTKGISSFYWTKKWNSRATRMRHLNRFVELSNMYGGSNIKESIKKATISKINELINIESTLQNETNVQLLRNAKNETNVPKMKGLDNSKNETNVHVDKGGKRFIFNNSIRVCKVTSLSLEIGIKQNEVLSAKGVEYYYQNERAIYDKVLYPRLSDKWKDKPLEKQFSEIAHSLRNERSNSRNNLRRDLRRREQDVKMMFDFSEMLRVDKRTIYIEHKQAFQN